MVKTFAQRHKSYLVYAITIIFSIPLFSVAVNISWFVIDKIAQLILVKKIFDSNSDLLFGSIIVSIFVVLIFIVHKTVSKVRGIFTESESNIEILKEVTARVAFILLLGFAYPFTVQALSIVMDRFF